MDRISKGYGVRLHYLPVRATYVNEFLAKGIIDVAISSQNTDLNQNVHFTMPIVKTKGVLLVRMNTKVSQDGQGLKILLIEFSPAFSSLRKIFPKAEFISCSSTEEVIKKGINGEGNAMAGNEMALIRFLGKEELDTNWERASGYVYETK